MNIKENEIYRLLVDAVNDYAIFSLDVNGNIQTWNTGARTLKGYKTEEILGKHFSVFYTPHDIETQHPQEELRIAKQVGKFEEEGWRVRKDGSQFWASVVINKLTDSSGQFIGFSKVTRDLTDKKRAQEILRESEERFRLLVNNVQDYGILTLDTEGKVVTWNTGAERIKGYKASEIIGQHFSKFYLEDDVLGGKTTMELRVAREEGRYEEEGWRVRKDGSLFWANVVITSLKDENGTLRGYAKVTRDLTAKKQSDEALKQSQERYRLLIESVKDYAIIMLDTQGRITSWNAGAERINGYKAEEILGTHFSKFYLAADNQAGKPAKELEIATAEGRFEEEGLRIRKNGQEFWASVVLTPVWGGDGVLRGFSKVTRDISERKVAERKLNELNESLEKKVESRTSELSSAVKARDEFLSMASHELNTPLTTLKLKSQMRQKLLTKKGVAHFSEETLIQMFKEDEVHVNRLTRLVDDMLDIARLGGGKLSIRKEEFDLSSHIEEIAKRYKSQLIEAKCNFTFKSSGELRGEWDPYRVEQIFVNLLTNAIKYGGQTPIEVNIYRMENRAFFSVKDFGKGISPEDQERIFQQFERAESTSDISGLGLGLYIVKKIVDLHEGQIRLESKLGEGSTFTVELPLK